VSRQTDRQKSLPIVLRAGMTDRATCWSITINNPKDSEIKPNLPAQWVLKGQMERGAEGTEHFQAMLITPQVRFSAVKKVFPRAHIEVARKPSALAQYVKKDDTRVGDYQEHRSEIPSWYEYSNQIAKRFDLAAYRQRLRDLSDKEQFNVDRHAEIRLEMVDEMVASDIESGMKGIEWIAVNPNFRQAWKRYGVSLAKREQAEKREEGSEGSEGEDDETIDRS